MTKNYFMGRMYLLNGYWTYHYELSKNFCKKKCMFSKLIWTFKKNLSKKTTLLLQIGFCHSSFPFDDLYHYILYFNSG